MADREHLYRGKRVDNDEWVEGNLYRLSEERNPFIMLKNSYGASYEVIPETVGECTGVPDKNGNMIFEDYILQSRASEDETEWKYWKVEYYDGSFVFTHDTVYRKKHKHEENLLCADEVELYGLVIVGNVRDNADLLEA